MEDIFLFSRHVSSENRTCGFCPFLSRSPSPESIWKHHILRARCRCVLKDAEPFSMGNMVINLDEKGMSESTCLLKIWSKHIQHMLCLGCCFGGKPMKADVFHAENCCTSSISAPCPSLIPWSQGFLMDSTQFGEDNWMTCSFCSPGKTEISRNTGGQRSDMHPIFLLVCSRQKHMLIHRRNFGIPICCCFRSCRCQVASSKLT